MSHEHKLAADASSAVFSALLQASSDAKLERLRRLAVGTTLARGFQQPCWPRWATIKSAQLWELVALSLDVEPTLMAEYQLFEGTASPAGDSESTDRTTQICQAEHPLTSYANLAQVEMLDRLLLIRPFVDRLRIAANSLLTPSQQLAADADRASSEMRARVLVSDFIRMATQVDWPLPPGFPLGTSGTVPSDATDTAGGSPTEVPPKVFQHRLQTRQNEIGKLIELACQMAGGSLEMALVWPQLEELARKDQPMAPLKGLAPGGITYRKGTQVVVLTKAALKDRLTRMRKRAGDFARSMEAR